MKSIISDLHLKFAEKTWNETFQLVRRCMDKSRDESQPCEPLVRSLERLQEVFNVSSLSTMKSRLEMIAKQQGMGFHITEATCYMTADLFYLEVVLLPCGGVQEVKVAPHGGSPVPSESLLQLLRSKQFPQFSMKLADIFTQYNIPGDNEVKLKLFTSLQCLGKDLQLISALPREPKDSDPQVDLINNGRIGCLTAGRDDCPLTIQFYITLSTEVKASDSKITDPDRFVQSAQVSVGVSEVTHTLQMASVMPQPPQLDPQGSPVFLPLTETPNETLPACFLLRLQPAIPVVKYFIDKISQITDMTLPDVDLQWAPLPKLLRTQSSKSANHGKAGDELDSIFTVPLPAGGMHSYVFPGASWEAPALRAAMMDSVPFTHPAHVPALLDLLRHQCVINALLRGCVTPQQDIPVSVPDLRFEILPESETSFSITFQRPDADSLAVLLVNVSDSRQITCTLFGAGMRDPSMDEDMSGVMNRCVSIPVTLQTLYGRLLAATSAPLSPSGAATAEAENDHSAPAGTAMTATSGALTTQSQGASVPEDGFSVSGSACYAVSISKSELLPEIKPSPAVDPYPFSAVAAFPHWMNNNGQRSELI